ncbi:MAG: hypothetical protein ABI169_04245, partial [Chitinophagaceae bacterium]
LAYFLSISLSSSSMPNKSNCSFSGKKRNDFLIDNTPATIARKAAPSLLAFTLIFRIKGLNFK